MFFTLHCFMEMGIFSIGYFSPYLQFHIDQSRAILALSIITHMLCGKTRLLLLQSQRQWRIWPPAFAFYNSIYQYIHYGHCRLEETVIRLTQGDVLVMESNTPAPSAQINLIWLLIKTVLYSECFRGCTISFFWVVLPSFKRQSFICLKEHV